MGYLFDEDFTEQEALDLILDYSFEKWEEWHRGRNYVRCPSCGRTEDGYSNFDGKHYEDCKRVKFDNWLKKVNHNHPKGECLSD